MINLLCIQIQKVERIDCIKTVGYVWNFVVLCGSSADELEDSAV